MLLLRLNAVNMFKNIQPQNNYNDNLLLLKVVVRILKISQKRGLCLENGLHKKLEETIIILENRK